MNSLVEFFATAPAAVFDLLAAHPVLLMNCASVLLSGIAARFLWLARRGKRH